MKATWIVAAAALAVPAMATPAFAFAGWDSAQAAQASCPNQPVVWLEFGKNEYVVKNQQGYGDGSGAYACEAKARGEGFFPST